MMYEFSTRDLASYSRQDWEGLKASQVGSHMGIWGTTCIVDIGVVYIVRPFIRHGCTHVSHLALHRFSDEMNQHVC